MYQHGNKYLLEQLNFRDYLRENSKARDDYEKLKFKLSNLNNKNRHKYAEEKTTFIKNILEKIININ